MGELSPSIERACRKLWITTISPASSAEPLIVIAICNTRSRHFSTIWAPTTPTSFAVASPHDEDDMDVTPNTEEKYISFRKRVSSTMKLRFFDTFRCMASSLGNLAANLPDDGFRHLSMHVSSELLPPLLKQKWIFPYEYVTSWDKLEDSALPPRKAYHSSLTKTMVCPGDYQHAQRVWEAAGVTTLGEYRDLYLKMDVLLLADVLENFRSIQRDTDGEKLHTHKLNKNHERCFLNWH